MANFNADVLKALGTGSAPGPNLFGLTPEQIANISRANIASEGQASDLAMSVAGALGQRAGRRQQAGQFERTADESARRFGITGERAGRAEDATARYREGVNEFRRLQELSRQGDAKARLKALGLGNRLAQERVKIAGETQRLRVDEAVNKAVEVDKKARAIREITEGLAGGGNILDFTPQMLALDPKGAVENILKIPGREAETKRKVGFEERDITKTDIAVETSQRESRKEVRSIKKDLDTRIAKAEGVERKQLQRESDLISSIQLNKDTKLASDGFVAELNSTTNGDIMYYWKDFGIGGFVDPEYTPIRLGSLRKKLKDSNIDAQYIRDSADKLNIDPVDVLIKLIKAKRVK